MTDSHDALLRRVEQFYFREARLLDNRQFKGWLALLSDDVRYRLPARYVPQPDPALRGREAYHDPAQEFCDALPWREETALTLTIRAERALKPNAWAENPPARTRRFISNVELESLPDGVTDRWRCWSNFLLTYSRHDQPTRLYSGQREDILCEQGGGLRLLVREVRLDCSLVEAPGLGLFF